MQLMKTKAVFWAKNNDEKRLLFAMQLKPESNSVESWIFPEEITTPEFVQLMNDKWRDNQEVAFPEGFQHATEELSVAKGLLSPDLKPENPELISRLQAEWHFMVLSSKLHEAYKSELASIADNVNNMTKYSGALWDSLKNFWSKVQDNVRDKNLTRDHADQLRETTNVLFTKLKESRTALSGEFEEKSKIAYSALTSKLDEIETKIQEGILRFPQIFDMLRNTQAFYKEQKMTRDHGNQVWDRLDGLFKKIKQTKFGVAESANTSERLENRMEGLAGVIQKMQQGINRDKQDLVYEQKRADQSQGQLEQQIRLAKINMIVERIKNKEAKLADMIKTQNDVESKMAYQKMRDTKKAEKATAPVTATTETTHTEVVVEHVAPVVETPEVVTEHIAPVVETHEVATAHVAPVVETHEVVTEHVAPVVETHEVVAEHVAPAVETPKVVAEHVAPVVETPKVVAEHIASVVETPEVVAEHSILGEIKHVADSVVDEIKHLTHSDTPTT